MALTKLIRCCKTDIAWMYRWLMCICISLLMGACGGGNKTPNSANPPGTDSQGSVATAIIDVLPTSTLLSTSGAEVEVSAVLKNSANVALEGVKASFSTTSGNLVAVNTVSDASGVVKAKISVGSDKSLRTITVTVSVGTVSGKTVLEVKDASVMVAPVVVPTYVDVLASSTIVPSSGAEVLVTAYVKNAANVVMPGVTVSFATSTGNLIPVSTVTDASGAVTAKLSAGADKSSRDLTVTVIAGTASGSMKIAVSDVNTNATPSSVDVLTSSNVLQSTGAEVQITSVVKSASNVALQGVNVSFATSSGSLVAVTTVTDASGVVTARLSAGSNKSIRDITVTVTAGTVSGTNTVAVTDTKVTLSGNSSLKQGSQTGLYTIRAVDAANAAISGATFTVASSLSNGLSATQLQTDSAGNASFSYTPTNAGEDTITVSGLGLVTTNTVSVSDVDFTVVSPANNTLVTVGETKDVTVRYLVSGIGQADRPVTFTVTRGSIKCKDPCKKNVKGEVVTDENGQVTAELGSITAGPATVQAEISGVGSVSLPIQFVAASPSSVVVQASPSTVQPNSAGNTSNQTTIEAVVRDDNLNAVANATVYFTLETDLSNGYLSAGGVAKTDINGRAKVQFIPGENSTANNGVVVKATASGVSGKTNLTVSGQALYITLAFGNSISSPDETSYSKKYSVYVTDVSGGAVVNQPVTLKVIPVEYYKGSMNYNSTKSIWEKTVIATCPSEDLNQNGILDPGEDVDANPLPDPTFKGNSNGKLEPGNLVVISPSSVTTDAKGFATFSISYGKQYALWAKLNIVAQTNVAGTESSNESKLLLQVANADISDPDIPPAGENSPFGQGLNKKEPVKTEICANTD